MYVCMCVCMCVHVHSHTYTESLAFSYRDVRVNLKSFFYFRLMSHTLQMRIAIFDEEFQKRLSLREDAYQHSTASAVWVVQEKQILRCFHPLLKIGCSC